MKTQEMQYHFVCSIAFGSPSFANPVEADYIAFPASPDFLVGTILQA